MAESEILGVLRERRFSPGREDDDRAILEQTADRLRAAGVAVTVVAGEEFPAREWSPRLVFAMCQSTAALAALDALAARCPVVNAPAAIRNCHRFNMLPRLDAAGVPQPRWRLVRHEPPAAFHAGVWLKRGDVHAMEAGDVRRVATESEWKTAMDDLSQRGVGRVIVQEHAEGSVYKFYGVTGGFFRAYGLEPGRERAAASLAAAGAAALGLEVYGGDGVSMSDGRLVLVDVNDWPSFSRCRDDAADAIARRLLEILEGKRRAQ